MPRSLKILNILSLFLFVTCTNAQSNMHQLPVFNDAWYLEKNYSSNGHYFVESYYDQCLNDQYVYEFSSNSKDYLVNKYLEILPKHDDCTWKIDTVRTSDSQPMSYPTSDWSELVKDNNAIRAYDYHFKCVVINQYDYVVYSDYVKISPVYTCPKGARADNKYDGKHCYESAPLCNADIVGRDLQSKYLFWAGHVALTQNTNEVLEVLSPKNEYDPAIQTNTFNSFRFFPNTTFWGDVYGYHNQEKLTFLDAFGILSAGEYQKMFDPIYTPIAFYKEGGLIKKKYYDYFSDKIRTHNVMQQAFFRCDTFIQYCYKKGANIIINEQIPRVLYKSFNYVRDALPKFMAELYSDSNDDIPEKPTCDSSQCFEQLINKLIIEKATYEDIFLAIDEYGNYSNNEEKYQGYVLNLYKNSFENYNLNTKLHNYLLQKNLISSEQASMLLDLYSKPELRSIEKIKILRLFKYMFIYDPDSKEDFDIKTISNIKRVNEIIIGILKNSNNFLEVILAAEVAEQIMPEDKSQEFILDALLRVHRTSNKNSMKIDDDLIIHEIFNNKNPHGSIFDRSESFNKKMLLLIANFDKKYFHVKTKKLLKKYLINIHKIQSLSGLSKAETNEALSNELLWAAAYRKLMGQVEYKIQFGLFDYNSQQIIKAATVAGNHNY